MKEYIAFDSHKHYTLVEWEDVASGRVRQRRVEHEPGAIRACLAGGEPGTPVAVEATGNWYWIVSEIEEAGLQPRLVHPRKAKLMMGMINKTDKLDVHGLNRLQRNNTLPAVWIPPGPLRDLRELTRFRMVLARHRTRLKNRLQANLAKFGLRLAEPVSDLFAAKVDLDRLFAPQRPQFFCRPNADNVLALDGNRFSARAARIESVYASICEYAVGCHAISWDR